MSKPKNPDANFKFELDLGSIRSSTRNGLSTPYRLTIWNSARLFHHVLFNMGDLHLVLPALNLSTLNFDNHAKSKIDDVLTEHSGLLHVLPLAVQLGFFVWTSRGDHSEPFLLFEFFCETPLSCLKCP